MLLVDCPGHGEEVLIWTSGIDRIRNTATGIEVDYHCTCGHRGVWRPVEARGASANADAVAAGEGAPETARGFAAVPGAVTPQPVTAHASTSEIQCA